MLLGYESQCCIAFSRENLEIYKTPLPLPSLVIKTNLIDMWSVLYVFLHILNNFTYRKFG